MLPEERREKTHWAIQCSKRSVTIVVCVWTPRIFSGDGGETFREALDIAILPRLQDFSPDLIVISAGFDAHRNRAKRGRSSR